MSEAVPFVGLTGGLGAGKSTALAALAELGAAVISSDAVVHELYAGPELRAAVVERFGEEVAPGRRGRPDGARGARVRDRGGPSLARAAGVADGGRARGGVARAGARAQDPPPRAAVVEVPLLFEAGLESAYDATIAVVADEQLRSERAAGRGHAVVDERARASSPRTRRPGGRRSSSATTDPRRICGASCRASLAS